MAVVLALGSLRQEECTTVSLDYVRRPCWKINKTLLTWNKHLSKYWQTCTSELFPFVLCSYGSKCHVAGTYTLQASVHREGRPTWGIIGQPPRPWFLPGGVELAANPSSDLWRLCCPCGQQDRDWGAGLSHRHERTEWRKDQCWWGQKGIGEGRQGLRLATVLQAQLKFWLLLSSILLSRSCSCFSYPYPRAPQGPEAVWSTSGQKPGKLPRFCTSIIFCSCLPWGPHSWWGWGPWQEHEIQWRTCHHLNQNVYFACTWASFSGGSNTKASKVGFFRSGKRTWST